MNVVDVKHRGLVFGIERDEVPGRDFAAPDAVLPIPAVARIEQHQAVAWTKRHQVIGHERLDRPAGRSAVEELRHCLHEPKPLEQRQGATRIVHGVRQRRPASVAINANDGDQASTLALALASRAAIHSNVALLTHGYDLSIGRWRE